MKKKEFFNCNQAASYFAAFHTFSDESSITDHLIHQCPKETPESVSLFK
jgi:hypothetical protein